MFFSPIHTEKETFCNDAKLGYLTFVHGICIDRILVDRMFDNHILYNGREPQKFLGIRSGTVTVVPQHLLLGSVILIC